MYTCIYTYQDASALQILYPLNGASYPSLNTLIGCMAYLEFWLIQQPDWTELDQNSGLAPPAWVEEVKRRMRNVHTCVDGEFTKYAMSLVLAHSYRISSSNAALHDFRYMYVHNENIMGNI